MGVTGLWRLIEPAGKPVPVETLENKVLAVDISIWLHQMVKGYQDAKGAPLPNAHLMGLFQRLCKLLYFRIKPIFVFDGGFPDLKKETIAKRQDSKAKYHSESERLKRELALILSKKTTVNSLLGKQISPKKSYPDPRNDDDIFKLPALPEREESESESEDESNSSGSIIDVHSVDIESDNFKTLPAKEKYDLLIELKETRKMSSWGRLHELPRKSDNFSDFQMQRLLKRKKVQECLQETEKEMGDTGMSLNDLESLLNEEGIDTKIDTMPIPSRRIASDNSTRFLLISNVRQALVDAKKREEAEKIALVSKEESKVEEESIKKDELEEDLEKAIKMSLECVDEPETTVKHTPVNSGCQINNAPCTHIESEVNNSACLSKTDDSWTSLASDSDKTDSEEDDGFVGPESLSTAKAYIMQYTDFTHKTIEKMLVRKNKKSASKVQKVDEIIDELNKEKSVIVDNLQLSSSDDEVELISENNKIDLSKSIHDLDLSTDVDATQASVVCLDNPTQEVITLDTSTEEENLKITQEIKKNPTKATPMLEADEIENNKICKAPSFQIPETGSKKSSSESSDDEFEEVSDIEEGPSKHVVEVTVDIEKAPEDDIFADIFCKPSKSSKPYEPVAGPSGIVVKKESKEISRDSNSTDEESSNDVPENIVDHEQLQENGSQPSETTVSEVTETNVAEVSVRRYTDIITPKDSNRVTVKEITTVTEEMRVDKHIKENAQAVSNVQSSTDIENKDSKRKEKPLPSISTEALNSMAEELQNEEKELLQEKGRLDRVGRNITEQMTKEAQELLQIFGIPYIVAPMEAEAQCAFLETVKLTDGTITDDSDIWLFGGRTVYKNFFNQKKHVLQFLAERIERSFNLTREQLILLALLVGSDYTTGVTGVGPVTAMEILASFPFSRKQFLNEASRQAQLAKMVAGLQEFKQWVRAGKRTDNSTLKKKLKNVELGDDFPSLRVVQAYLEPNIEKSEEKFTWGELDLAVLRDYTKTKFGWSQNKLDEIINPVLKRLQDRKSQKTVHDYFKRKIEFQCLDEQVSKRVKAAVDRMGPETPLQVLSTANEPEPKKAKNPRKNNTKKKETGATVCNDNETNTIEADVLNDHKVRVVSQIQDGKSSVEITIPKTDRFQEIIPQREKDKQSLLENKMRAIEVFRKTKIDRKKKTTKRRPNLPKEKADLSESDSN